MQGSRLNMLSPLTKILNQNTGTTIDRINQSRKQLENMI